MKKIKLIALFSLMIISKYSNANNNFQDTSVNVIECNYLQIRDIVMEMQAYYKNIYNPEKSVFIINVKKDVSKYDFRISVIYRDDFGWILRDKQMKLFGYFEVAFCPVLVFGEPANYFFSLTNESKQLTWFKALPQIKKRKTNIEEPPVIFEPEVWLYRFEDGKLQYDKKGLYLILD